MIKQKLIKPMVIGVAPIRPSPPVMIDDNFGDPILIGPVRTLPVTTRIRVVDEQNKPMLASIVISNSLQGLGIATSDIPTSGKSFPTGTLPTTYTIKKTDYVTQRVIRKTGTTVVQLKKVWNSTISLDVVSNPLGFKLTPIGHTIDAKIQQVFDTIWKINNEAAKGRKYSLEIPNYKPMEIIIKQGDQPIKPVPVTTTIKVLDASTGSPISAKLYFGLAGLKGLGASARRNGDSYLVYFEPKETFANARITADGYSTKQVKVYPGGSVTVVLNKAVVSTNDKAKRLRLAKAKAKARIRKIKLLAI